MQALHADAYRELGGFSWKRLLNEARRRVEVRTVLTYRLWHVADEAEGPLRFTRKILGRLHRYTSLQAGIDLPVAADIGPGFAVAHGFGLVVTPGATIGSNVTVFHGVTIGQRDQIGRDGTRTTGYPVIEDEVWIGPNAIIVGGITIGAGSRIGPGAYVTESIPPRSIVIGNPGVIVKSDCTPDVPNRAPI